MKKYIILFLGLLALNNANAQDWQWQNPLPQGNYISSIYFTDIDTDYDAGSSGTILKTIKGGTVGLNEKPAAGSFHIYPNPASREVIVETIKASGPGIISVYELTGKKMIEQRTSGSKSLLNISVFPSGIYFVKYVSPGFTETGKFIKD
jgi:hypothetical protein